MSTRNKMIMAMLSGATIGAIIALLTAPGKGSELRSKVSDTAGKWVDSMGRLFSKQEKAVKKMSKKMASS